MKDDLAASFDKSMYLMPDPFALSEVEGRVPAYFDFAQHERKRVIQVSGTTL